MYHVACCLHGVMQPEKEQTSCKVIDKGLGSSCGAGSGTEPQGHAILLSLNSESPFISRLLLFEFLFVRTNIYQNEETRPRQEEGRRRR